MNPYVCKCLCRGRSSMRKRHVGGQYRACAAGVNMVKFDHEPKHNSMDWIANDSAFDP